MLLDDGEVSEVSQLAPEQTFSNWLGANRLVAAVWRTINTSFCDGLHAALRAGDKREGDSRRSRIRCRRRNHSGSVTGASSRIDGYKTRASPEVRRKPGRIDDVVVPRCRRVASPAAAGIRRSRIRARKIPTAHIVQRLQKLLGTIVGQPAQVDPRTIDPARLNRVRDCHRGRRRLRQKNSSIAHQHQKTKCQRES